MPADVITWIEELAKSITYDGSDLGKEDDQHEPKVVGVTPIDVDNEATILMTVDVNAENAGALNVYHDDMQ